MSGEIRAFIAIELDDSLRKALRRVQRQLQDERALRAVRWVAPQNLHLTLKFLGNVERTRVPALTDALTRAARGVAPFQLTARGLGCFPNTRRPNNLWVALDGTVGTADLLARRVEEECAARGWARDKNDFAPHLTLGRVKRNASNAERSALGAFVEHFPDTVLGTMSVDAVFLIQSELRPGGPIYSPLARVELK